MAPSREADGGQHTAASSAVKQSIETKKRPVADDNTSPELKRQRTEGQEQNSVHSSWAALDNFIFNWLDSSTGQLGRQYQSEPPKPSEPAVIFAPRAQSLPTMGQKEDLAPATPSSFGGSSDGRVRGRGRRHSAASGSMAPPASIPSRASSVSTRGALVELPNYRLDNLGNNGIRWELDWQRVPADTQLLARAMEQDRRSSPEPSHEEIRANHTYHDLLVGCDERALQKFVDFHFMFNEGEYRKMQVSEDVLISNDWVPSRAGLDRSDRVSQPKPDALYGYQASSFGESQRLSMSSLRQRMICNNQMLMLPFLVIEYKADGPASNGRLWVAENQCFGASAACINMVRHLNEAHSAPMEHKRLDDAIFSIAMSNQSATVFVSWQEEREFLSAAVESYSMRKPADVLHLRRTIRNIIDWGMTKRLECIREYLDILLEEKRLSSSQDAKNRERCE